MRTTLMMLLVACVFSGLVAAQEETATSTAVLSADGDDDDENNVGLAVALSIGAGLATTIGGSVPFFPFLVKYAHANILAASLALSSGVMLYVSFIEVFIKSADSFTLGLGNGPTTIDGSETEELGFAYPGDKYGNLYATLAFFVGCILLELLHRLVHYMSPVTSDLDDISVVSKAESARMERESRASEGSVPEVDVENQNNAPDDNSANKAPTKGDLDLEGEGGIDGKRKELLSQMGLLTALAIALHNFPEGFATFMATLDEPSLGAGLAIAVAIHNIPEGICIAMPIYYATGSKWKGFGWAFLSGLSEPIGGILGWVALKSVFTDAVFGIVFGIVGGMMVWIVLGELLPTCFSHDPEGKVVKPFLYLGMVVMSASLIAFSFA